MPQDSVIKAGILYELGEGQHAVHFKLWDKIPTDRRVVVIDADTARVDIESMLRAFRYLSYLHEDDLAKDLRERAERNLAALDGRQEPK